MNLSELLEQDLGYGPGNYSRLFEADGEDLLPSHLPVVDDYEKRLRQVAELVVNKPSMLWMPEWHHSCGTRHCIGGWAIFLGGTKAATLERINGPDIAAYILLGAEAYRHFYESSEDALAWLKEVVARPLS